METVDYQMNRNQKKRQTRKKRQEKMKSFTVKMKSQKRVTVDEL